MSIADSSNIFIIMNTHFESHLDSQNLSFARISFFSPQEAHYFIYSPTVLYVHLWAVQKHFFLKAILEILNTLSSSWRSSCQIPHQGQPKRKNKALNLTSEHLLQDLQTQYMLLSWIKSCTSGLHTSTENMLESWPSGFSNFSYYA